MLIAALLIAPAVVGAARVTNLGRLLTSKVVVWVGLVSYGLYLWHMFVLHQVVDLYDGFPLQIVSVPFIAAGCYQLTLGVAAISWYGVERRVLSLAHRVPLARTLSGNVNKGVVK